MSSALRVSTGSRGGAEEAEEAERQLKCSDSDRRAATGSNSSGAGNEGRRDLTGANRENRGIEVGPLCFLCFLLFKTPGDLRVSA
jgi:hypothetical protein